MEDHARDVIGLLDALGLDRVVMGGHSFGGLLTYWLAANHPERVERCVVLDAPASVNPTMMEQIQPSLDRLGQVYASWDEYLALVRAMPYFAEGGWDADVESYFRADVRVRARRDGAGALPSRAHPRGGRGRVDVDWPALAARVTQPTLLLQGARQLRAARLPAAPLAGDAEATVGVDGRLHGSSTGSATTSRSCSGQGRRS